MTPLNVDAYDLRLISEAVEELVDKIRETFKPLGGELRLEFNTRDDTKYIEVTLNLDSHEPRVTLETKEAADVRTD